MVEKPSWDRIIGQAVMTLESRCLALNGTYPDYVSLTKVVDEIKKRRKWTSKHQIEMSVRNHVRHGKRFKLHENYEEMFIQQIRR